MRVRLRRISATCRGVGCGAARRRLLARLGSSLSTRSSGVRSAAGSRSGAGRRRRRRGGRAASGGAARPRGRRGSPLPACASTSRSRDQFLELVARELLARLLGGDQAAAPGAPALALGLDVLGRARRPSVA